MIMKYGDCSEKDALKTNSSLLMENEVTKTLLVQNKLLILHERSKIGQKQDLHES